MKKLVLSSLSLAFFIANLLPCEAHGKKGISKEKENVILQKNEVKSVDPVALSGKNTDENRQQKIFKYEVKDSAVAQQNSELKNLDSVVLREKEIAENRQKVVKCMEDMSEVEWSPLKDILYWNPKRGFVYKEGGIYYGIPYTQIKRDVSLEKFCENLKEEDGKKVYVGPYKNGEYLGTDCSMAVLMSWSLIDDSVILLDDTVGMFKNLGKSALVPVGEYRYTGGEQSTLDINKNNGKEVIFKSYEKLQPGDALLTCSYDWGWHTGHIRMVVNVDVENKTIEYIDQAGVDNYGILYSKDGKSSWRRSKVSFEESFEKGYIAVGLSKLLNKSKV